jgi:hypothetical protein
MTPRLFMKVNSKTVRILSVGDYSSLYLHSRLGLGPKPITPEQDVKPNVLRQEPIRNAHTKCLLMLRDVVAAGDSRLLRPRDRFRDPRRGDPALPRRLGEGHVQRAEDRGQRAKGRGQRTEGKGQSGRRESVRRAGAHEPRAAK